MEVSAIGLLGTFGQKPDQISLGATAKQQIESLSLRGENGLPASSGPIRRSPVGERKIAVIGRVLNHAIQ